MLTALLNGAIRAKLKSFICFTLMVATQKRNDKLAGARSERSRSWMLVEIEMEGDLHTHTLLRYGTPSGLVSPSPLSGSFYGRGSLS